MIFLHPEYGIGDGDGDGDGDGEGGDIDEGLSNQPEKEENEQ